MKIVKFFASLGFNVQRWVYNINGKPVWHNYDLNYFDSAYCYRLKLWRK